MAIDSTADLLNLLSMCDPDNARLEKEAQIATLVSTPAYQKLAQDTRFRTLFKQYYAPEALEKLSLQRIRRARSAIPVAADCFRTIARSIYTGPAPTLTKTDFPDFYSASSLQNLARKLSPDNMMNYTNIPELDFMEIFSDVTIRRARDVFGEFPENAYDYPEQIERVAAGRPYCISTADVERTEDLYEMELARLDAVGRNSTRGWLGVRRHRLWVALGVLSIAALIYVIGGLHQPMIEGTAMMLIALLGVLLIVWG